MTKEINDWENKRINDRVNKYINEGQVRFCCRLLDHLKQQLYACKKQLVNSQDRAGNEIIINRYERVHAIGL